MTFTKPALGAAAIALCAVTTNAAAQSTGQDLAQIIAHQPYSPAASAAIRESIVASILSQNGDPQLQALAQQRSAAGGRVFGPDDLADFLRTTGVEARIQAPTVAPAARIAPAATTVPTTEAETPVPTEAETPVQAAPAEETTRAAVSTPTGSTPPGSSGGDFDWLGTPSTGGGGGGGW